MNRPRNSGYDYGECEICDTRMVGKRITQDFWIRGKLVVVEGIPAGVCPRCGEKVVKSEVGRSIAELMEDREQIAKARRISVPTMRFGRVKAAV
ncbi:MAG: YgiT-type zinc finger protein [Planctomycetes bacterium]|nr:YgiT-type zinc finger protein [Planctomycetota bacterium]MBM4079722.1 YgiT-type zinc finger protein [Planctomycetota bacterium]